MDLLIPAAAAGLAMASASHAASIALAMQRVARGRLRPSPLASAGVSILRPVCGIEYRIEATLVSSFQIDHPSYEVIFCVAAADDPVVPIVRRLIREHPEVPATLLVGDEGGGPNPKLANLVKAWDVATHDWIVLADSNVLMPPDYLDRLFARWTERVAFVCSPPVGIDVHGSAAELEAAFLNTFQARWQLAVEELGFGFVHGKTMLLRRSDLAGEGGLAALAREVAEDAAAIHGPTTRAGALPYSAGMYALPVDDHDHSDRSGLANQMVVLGLLRTTTVGAFAAAVILSRR
jgi:ceramide glucosyltransferase